MMIPMVLVAAIGLLVGLIKAEKTADPKKILAFKTPLSLLFILAWALQPAQNPSFAGLILIALVFCLGGDVLLALGSQKTFLAGLVSFLLGHVMYAAAFFTVVTVGRAMAVATVVLMAVAVWVWRWLEPHLGEMQTPVLAYIVIISIMVCSAAGLAANPKVPDAAQLTILTGAILFFISDLFVARQRFVADAHVNRQIGLPLYYAGQFLLAFSAAWVPS